MAGDGGAAEIEPVGERAGAAGAAGQFVEREGDVAQPVEGVAGIEHCHRQAERPAGGRRQHRRSVPACCRWMAAKPAAASASPR